MGFLSRSSSSFAGAFALSAWSRCSQDAAVRQQERVPGDRRHAEGTTLKKPRRVRATSARILKSSPEVSELSDLRGHGVALQLQRPGAPLLSAPRTERRRYSGEPVAEERTQAQSHEIAKQVRQRSTPIAERYGARIKVAEVPPGPPVLQTLVAEVYGPDYERQIAVARQIRDIFEQTEGVVDVDWYVEDDQPKYRFAGRQGEGRAQRHLSRTDRDDAAASPLAERAVGLLHQRRGEGRRVHIVRCRLPRAQRSGLRAISSRSKSSGRDERRSPSASWSHIEKRIDDKSIYHKNLMPVTYVTADVAGEIESPVYAILKLDRAIDKFKLPEGYGFERYIARQPLRSPIGYAMKWDGEWHITYEVFRDLGIAFAAVLILIYILVVGWFQSFMTPLMIMAAIPFSLVGILPAHGLLGAFFTATSMIGFIAGAGIVVRNSIILVDFIELRLQAGHAAGRGRDRRGSGALPSDDADRGGRGCRRRR